jgi:hypothetical protein
MPTNTAPTLTALAVVDAPSGSTTFDYKSFLEGVAIAGSPVNIFQLTSLSTIEAGQSIISLSFTVSGLKDGADEKVILGDGSALVSATILSLAGGNSGSMKIADATYTVSVADDLLSGTKTATVTMTSTTGFTMAQTGALVANMQYQNTDASPTVGERLFTLTQIQDSGGGASVENTSALSIAAKINVVPTNDAPVLADVPLLALSSINEDSQGPTNGSTAGSTLVSALVTGITDLDGPSMGIAIAATKYGTWFYSTNDGANWTDINGVGGTVTSTNALLLLADTQTRLYFQPSPNDSGPHSDGLIFYAWDGSTGSAGSKVPLTNRGDSLAFHPLARQSMAVT